MRRQVLSLLVENNPGVTSHISGLFSRRGYNIDSFSSGVTADPRYTRITIVASGDEQILEQIEKQLAKLEDVVDIKKLEPGSSVTRELIMVNQDALFSGDTLFAQSVGRTDFPKGSASALIRGIKEKLLPLPDEVTVYTGHNDTTTIGTERRYNPYL